MISDIFLYQAVLNYNCLLRIIISYLKPYITVVGWLVFCFFYSEPTLFGSFNAKLSHFDKSFK